MQFSMDKTDLISIMNLYKKAPKKINRAAASVLNSIAFEARKKQIQTIHDNMTVRNQQFVVSSIRVKMAKSSMPLSVQSAEVGSIKRNRFTGWAEQELGVKAKRTKVATKLARGGSEKGQIAPRFRMKKGKNYPDPSEFKGSSTSNRVINMLQTLSAQKYNKPFVIKGYNKKFKPGLYKFQRRKIKRLQEFKTTKAQPKKIKWMTIANKAVHSSLNINKVWGNALKKQFKI